MQWGAETLSLPLYPELPEAEQDYVIETLLDGGRGAAVSGADRLKPDRGTL